MRLYRFTRWYKSERGEWKQGTTLELSDADAAWFKRDSPGCIEEVTSAAPRSIVPQNDRMVRAPKGKRK